MRGTERGWVRGAVVIGIAGTMMAVALLSPALAVRLATTSYVKAKISQSESQAEARFLDVAEGDGRYLEDGIVTIRGAPVTIPAGSENFVEVDCPAGMSAVGGGGYATATYMFLEASYPSNGANSDTDGTTAWTVWAFNDSGGPPGDLLPYVICARTSAQLQLRTARETR